jgi:branched-chain amino acid transport system permease protein
MIGQAIVDGILNGAIIALSAIGLTLSLRILGFANFAQAELMTWGGYFALAFLASFGAAYHAIGPFSFGWPLLAAAALSGLLTAGLAAAMDFLLFRPLRRQAAPPVTMVFMSFGASLVLRYTTLMIWGPQPAYYGGDLQIAIRIFSVRIIPDQVFVLGATTLIFVALQAFLSWTKTGLAMRAIAENPSLARVNGIDSEQMIRRVWMLSGALATAGGVLFGLTVQLRPEMGYSLLLSIFAAVIFGGAGNIGGAVVGGLLVGLCESISVLWINPGYKGAVPFVVLLLILFVRPQGLFASRAP